MTLPNRHMKNYLPIILGLGALICSCTNPTKDESMVRMLVGTLSEADGGAAAGKGIYLMEFNQDDASYRMLDSLQSGNPTFMAPSADWTVLYSVNEFHDGRQAASSYIMGEKGLAFTNTISTDLTSSGADPCNILELTDCIVTSNYTGGTLSAFRKEADGSLGPCFAQFVPGEDGPKSHMHCALLSPDGRYLFATDLGKDAVYRFTLAKGQNDYPFSEMKVAAQFGNDTHPGPRHMIFSADGRFAYLVHELSDQLTVFRYNDGELEMLDTMTAYDGQGHGSADLHLSPDGRFLYTSHRLKDDGISVYSIDPETGLASRVGFSRTGIHPRNFNITPNGRYLLCACRDSHCIKIFRIDACTGLLEDTGKAISLPYPMFCHTAL